MTKAELLSLLSLLAAPSASRAELGNHRNLFLRRRTRNLRQESRDKKDAAARGLEELSMSAPLAVPSGVVDDALDALAEAAKAAPTEAAGAASASDDLDILPAEGGADDVGAESPRTVLMSKGSKREPVRRRLAGSSLSMSAPVGDDADALEFFAGAEAALIEVVPEEPTEDATDGGAGGSGKPGSIKGDVAPNMGLWAKGGKYSKRRGRRHLDEVYLSMSIPTVDDAEALEFFDSAADLVAVEPFEPFEAIEVVPIVDDAAATEPTEASVEDAPVVAEVAAPEFFAGAEVAEIVVVDKVVDAVEAEDVSALGAKSGITEKSAKGAKSKGTKTKSSKTR